MDLSFYDFLYPDWVPPLQQIQGEFNAAIMVFDPSEKLIMQSSSYTYGEGGLGLLIQCHPIGILTKMTSLQDLKTKLKDILPHPFNLNELYWSYQLDLADQVPVKILNLLWICPSEETR